MLDKWRGVFREIKKPVAIFVCGLPGVGKSTIAQKITIELSAVYLSTDNEGYILFGDKRKYNDEYYKKLYEHMHSLAQENLKYGNNVVIDGTFLATEIRRMFIDLLRPIAGDIWLIYITCEESVIAKRLAKSLNDDKISRSYSEANFEIYLDKKRKLSSDPTYSDPRTEPNVNLVVIDNSYDREPVIVSVKMRD